MVFGWWTLWGVVLAIRQDRRLYLLDEGVWRAVQARREGTKGDVADRRGVGDADRLQQVTLRHMVDPGDVVGRHPGADGAHIPAERHLATLLQTMDRLHGLRREEDRHAQRETEQDTYTNQPETLIHRPNAPLIRTLG